MSEPNTEKTIEINFNDIVESLSTQVSHQAKVIAQKDAMIIKLQSILTEYEENAQSAQLKRQNKRK